MTDPIQQGNPQQQNPQQSSYVDDVLWWDDIFSPIPEIDDDDIPYGDLLEKKYQFEPIIEDQKQEVSSVPTQAFQTTDKLVGEPIVEPILEVEPIVEPIETQTFNSPDMEISVPLEPIAAEEIQNINQQSWVESVQVETLLDTKLQTDMQKKFWELFFTTKRIYELKKRLWITQETFDIIWANNDKIFISYRFFLDETNDPVVVITKIEENKETTQETENELRFTFNQEVLSLEVMVNNKVLFDEIQDLTTDAKKKMQVSEKFNKFIFLTSEEQKKLEKEMLFKEEEEREKRKLQDIFRNF